MIFAVWRRSAWPRALELFEWFNMWIGLRVTKSKSAVGPTQCYLGVELAFGDKGVIAKVSESRRLALLGSVETALGSGAISATDAASLAGKLGFAQFYTFARFGRA